MEDNQIKNKKVKKLPKIKVLDVVIVLLVLLAIVGVYFRYNSLSFFENSASKKQYEISFSIENIRYTTPDHVFVGDRVYLSESGEMLGTLLAASTDMKNIALKCTAASEYFMNEKGNMVEVNYPSESRVRAEGKMLCEGVYSSDGSFLVNGTTYLAAGKSLSVQTERVTVTIEIRDIQEVEKS